MSQRIQLEPLTSSQRDAVNHEVHSMRNEDGTWKGVHLTRQFNIADQSEDGYFYELEYAFCLELAERDGMFDHDCVITN